MLKPYHVVISSKDSLGWLDGYISDMPLCDCAMQL